MSKLDFHLPSCSLENPLFHPPRGKHRRASYPQRVLQNSLRVHLHSLSYLPQGSSCLPKTPYLDLSFSPVNTPTAARFSTNLYRMRKDRRNKVATSPASARSRDCRLLAESRVCTNTVPSCLKSPLCPCKRMLTQVAFAIYAPNSYLSASKKAIPRRVKQLTGCTTPASL